MLHTYTHKLILVLCLLVIIIFQSCKLDSSATVTISAGDIDRDNIPVVFNVPAHMITSDFYTLKNKENGKEVPVQDSEEGTVTFILDEPLAAGESREYELAAVVEATSMSGVTADKNEEQIDISVEATPVLSYQIATRMPADTLPDYYQRSGFIFPMYSPQGVLLTDDFPRGHTHQHSVFFAWVNTQWMGTKVDFWNQHQETGTVRNSGVGEVEQGPVFAGFETDQEHLAILEGDTTVVLEEHWKVTVYNTTGRFIWDITSTQQCVTDTPLLIKKYHYGGMGFRGSARWNGEEKESHDNPALFLTSEGKTRADGNHTTPFWADIYGDIGGKTAGFAAMGHPSNFRFPQPVRIHPDMPYFCFSPMVQDSFYLRKGEIYESSYRIVTHDGEPDAAMLDNIWEDYRNPVAVGVK